MSVEYISLGLTVQRDFPIEDFDTARVIVEVHREAIIARIAEIDAHESRPAELYEDDADWHESVLDEIAAGAMWAHQFVHDGHGWEIPEGLTAETFAFAVRGGDSFGDAPFEEYDAVVLAGDACSTIPALARALGIPGGGIRLAYDDQL